MGNSVYPVLLLLHKMVVLSGYIMAWYGSDRLVRWCMKKTWFVWLTAFSFVIYGLHAPLVAYAINAIFPLVQNIYEYRLVIYLLLPMGLTVFCIGTGIILRNLLPKFYALATGGRGL
jgi:membrane-bound acyltransferase YfiQ involved in biofilm formation